MKAVTYRTYGSPDVLKLEEVKKPTPTDDELLIKIHAVSINGTDKEGLIGKPLYARIGGLLKPRRQFRIVFHRVLPLGPSERATSGVPGRRLGSE